MSYTTILYDVAEGVATLTLNRPDRLNAFNVTMHEEVRAALAATARDESVRCLLLTGAGRGFCAGQDLEDRLITPSAELPDLGVTLGEYYNPLIRTLTGLPLPVVCAVNGVAAGAGANVALACDLVIAARSAKFIQAFCKIGLIPDSGGTWSLPRLVGRARAVGLALLGEALEAPTAVEWGLIWKAVDDAELMREAQTLARHFATQPTTGLALIKQAINASGSHSLDEQLELERDLQRQAGRTADYREGVRAFLDKRKPTFTGR